MFRVAAMNELLHCNLKALIAMNKATEIFIHHAYYIHGLSAFIDSRIKQHLVFGFRNNAEIWRRLQTPGIAL